MNKSVEVVCSEKVDAVKTIRERIEASSVTVFADYRGLSVQDMTELRKQCRAINSDMTVIKNTLIRRALGDLGLNFSPKILEGPTVLVNTKDDPGKIAKAIYSFIKEKGFLAVKGGVLDGSMLEESTLKALSKLPSRDELIARTVGGLKSPISGLVMTLASPIRGFIGVVQAIKTKKTGGE
ncbi:MAG: 50S ribosomal protein L10 [Candidatus Margulisbacteria bacterium]|nr:50S ribosomal protein L10 [Candidatus Margulisiibacteriota bacterium]